MFVDYVCQMLLAEVYVLKIAHRQRRRVCLIQRQDYVVFGVRFERRKYDKKANLQKLKHTNVDSWATPL